MSGYVLGLDYGSDSVRALLVDTHDGSELASAVVNYPRWSQGLYCDPARDQFRQHPLDYLESLQQALRQLWKSLPAGSGDKVIGISIDTTGSTPVAVDSQGQALALKPEFSDNPNAMFVLWKDHTALAEATEITQAANAAPVNYLQDMGGIYSSEWYWAKVLHVSRQDSLVHQAAHMWVEHCDWLPAVLTGTTHPSVLQMGRCAAGHKLMWNEKWQGFPPNVFFAGIDPLLDGLVERLNADTRCSDQKVGGLTEEWAAKLGLKAGTPVGFGAFDCHMGAVAANVRPGTLTKVMGTSTCDITLAEPAQLEGQSVPGICGQVNGSVVPGMVGLEAGQSAFGDLYAWFKDLLCWPLQHIQPHATVADIWAQQTAQIEAQILQALSEQAQNLEPGAGNLTALDWVNGRRTPDADQSVAMAISGLKMGSSAAHLFRALVEATAFGSRAITERFREQGVPVENIVVIGGISKKSDFVMQVCADVWNCPIDVLESEQSCALGAAIFAAVVGGAYGSVAEAQAVMASPVHKTYQPNPANVPLYDQLYARYQRLGQFVSGGE